jgi:peptide/nickel transport system ATP-binding protein/oligopeptide transport system ATP-binding protein
LFRRGVLKAVSGVSFHVKRGETLALVGESGCGKSTIGRCILRLIDPDGGAIRFQGQEIQQLSSAHFRPYRKHLQMVFQDPLGSFNPMMKISRALLEPLRLRDNLTDTERRVEVFNLLEHVKLDKRFADLYPRQMSGGQLQRVGIARAIASRPELIFLDEPTSALDMSIRGQIVNLLLDLQQEENLSYILVTHDLRLVRSMANRVLVMYLGEVVEEGQVEDIFSQPLHPYTRGLLAATLVGQGRAHRRREAIQLKGEVLAMSPEYVGCKLYKRCLFAQPRCAEEPQVLQEITPGRWVRCWRAEDIQVDLTKEVKSGQNTLHQP